jgi:hypothetical protein
MSSIIGLDRKCPVRVLAKNCDVCQLMEISRIRGPGASAGCIPIENPEVIGRCLPPWRRQLRITDLGFFSAVAFMDRWLKISRLFLTETN